MTFWLSSAIAVIPAARADDTLQQQQYLQREFREERFDLRLRQRQDRALQRFDAEPPPPVEPDLDASGRRLGRQQYLQQLRQRALQQRQSSTTDETDPGVREQLQRRERRAQELDFKLQSPH